jgi:hypothetical protein
VLDGPWANAATRPLAEVAKCGYDWSSACNAALWTPAADTLLCRYATERATRKGRYTPFTLHPADLFDDDVAVAGSDQSSDVAASPDSTTSGGGGGDRGGETCAQEDLPKLLLLKEVSQWQLSVFRPNLALSTHIANHSFGLSITITLHPLVGVMSWRNTPDFF